MDRQLSALIVDDEEKAVTLLQKLLEDSGHFGSLRSANSAIEAKRQLLSFHPDLIFLDIKMPGKDGLTFLRELNEKKHKAQVIFVTAFDQHALEAIRNHAIGYLLKPVDRKELSDCIAHYRSRASETNYYERLNTFLDSFNESRIRINTRTGYFLVDPAEILFCKADGNYCMINTGQDEHTCSIQLGMLQDMLPKNGFVRLGRSLIVNYSHVTRVDRRKNSLEFEKHDHRINLSVSSLQIKELEKHQQNR